MNRKIKIKWVEALRSGQYKQGKKRLKKLASGGTLEHCCLGVLCEIYLKEIGGEFTRTVDDEFLVNETSYKDLPEPVLKWADLPTSQIDNETPTLVNINYNDRYLNLGYLNDNVLNFAQIADLIEKEL